MSSSYDVESVIGSFWSPEVFVAIFFFESVLSLEFSRVFEVLGKEEEGERKQAAKL